MTFPYLLCFGYFVIQYVHTLFDVFLTGWLNDAFGDPKYGFLVFGVTEAIGGFVFLATYFVDKRVRRNLVTIPPAGGT